MTKISKFHSSLFIIRKCCTTIIRLWEAIEKHQQKGPLIVVQHFTNDLANYIILETVSLLEEYNTYFVETHVEDQYKARVKEIRLVLKPLIKRIYWWKDLTKFRDNFVAHGWREKKKHHQLLIPNQEGQDIPRKGMEFQYLTDLVKWFLEILKQEFSSELDASVSLALTMKPAIAKQKDISAINSEIELMVDEINGIMKSVNKNYTVSLHTYKMEK